MLAKIPFPYGESVSDDIKQRVRAAIPRPYKGGATAFVRDVADRAGVSFTEAHAALWDLRKEGEFSMECREHIEIVTTEASA